MIRRWQGRAWLAWAYGFVLLAALPAKAETVSQRRTEKTLSTRLANGLEVVLSEAREQPTFALALRYRVGSRDDPAQLDELAHLVEHLSFTFSKNVPGLHDKLTELAGVSSNAMTGLDATTYVTSGNVGALTRVLWLERQRMAFTLERLSERDVELERRTLDNERSTMRADDEAGLYWNFVRDALYSPGHPYAARQERGCIVRCTLNHARWLMQRGYRPDNARLVIVGDFDAQRELAEVERLFGSIEKPSVALAALPRVPPRSGSRHITITAPVDRPGLQLFWALPQLSPARQAQLRLLALQLELSLEDDLTEDAPLATTVDAGLVLHELGSYFTINVNLLPGVDTKQAEQRVLARVAELRRHFPSIELARQRRLMTQLELWDSPSSRASLLARSDTPGAELDSELATTRAVTQAGVEQTLASLAGQPSLSVSLRRAVDAPQRGELYREAP